MQPVEGVSAFPNGDNIFDWAATIEGSAGTVRLSCLGPGRALGCRRSACAPAQRPRQFPPTLARRGHRHLTQALIRTQVYEGLSYKLSVAFSEKYPYEAPTVKFVTACFHPNVDTAGNICLDILKDKWSAAFSVRTVLMSLQSLLGGTLENDLLLATFIDST
eukprot:COSAG02_NODE_323_length_24725_cov_57.558272_13_plen_162_part_00